jgi:hypothetical protein
LRGWRKQAATQRRKLRRQKLGIGCDLPVGRLVRSRDGGFHQNAAYLSNKTARDHQPWGAQERGFHSDFTPLRLTRTNKAYAIPGTLTALNAINA